MLCQDLALDPLEVWTAAGNELVSDPNSKSKLKIFILALILTEC